jgi:hypothetical protein
MPSLNYDLGYLQACVSDIEAYLLSKTLFWPTGGTIGTYPHLTLGGVLFALHRSQVMDLTPQQKDDLLRCELILNATRSRWQVAWGRKSQREFLSRLRQWQNYVNDLIKDPEDEIPYYSSEVRLRGFMSLLYPDMEQPDPVYLELLDNLDNALRLIFIPGDFVWEKEVASAFPKETYWYLWGVPGTE